MTKKEAVVLARTAVQETKKLTAEGRHASAYRVAAKAADSINRGCENRTLRQLFCRPGGGWSAMGDGAKVWLLNDEEYQAAQDLKAAVAAIPTDNYYGYTDK